MKRLILCCSLMACAARAQQYSIDWYSFAGSAARSNNGEYAVTEMLGPPSAGVAMSGGGYALTGGFWSIVSSVPTPGAPRLGIQLSGNGPIVISWPAGGSFVLEESTDIAGGWVATDYPVSTAAGTNSVTVASSSGRRFFRLSGQASN